MCQKLLWLIIFAGSWGKLKVIPFIIIPNGDIFLLKKKKEGMLVIYIQLLRWNRKWGSRKQLRVHANIHTLTATREKSRKSVSLEHSRAYLWRVRTPVKKCHLLYSGLYSGSLCLVISVVCCIGMCRFSCEILLFINIPFSDYMIFYIFIVLPQTFLSYMMYL